MLLLRLLIVLIIVNGLMNTYGVFTFFQFFKSDSKLRAFEPSSLELGDSCFKNQNKIGFNRYISCCNRIKRPNLDLLCFFQARDGRFK